MPSSQFGTDYSRFMTPVPGEAAWIPFPNPTNDAQRVQNARARAKRAGVDIGSGVLNPQSGELQDPDRGFGRAILSHPGIMVPAVLGGGLGLASLLGPSAAAGPGIPALGNVNAITDALAAGSPALGAAAPAAAAAGPAASAIRHGLGDQLRDAFSDPSTYASLASVIAGLSGGSGGGSGADANADQLRRINAISEAQMRRADPLHQVATNLAFSRLPINARQGVTMSNIPLPG